MIELFPPNDMKAKILPDGASIRIWITDTSMIIITQNPDGPLEIGSFDVRDGFAVERSVVIQTMREGNRIKVS